MVVPKWSYPSGCTRWPRFQHDDSSYTIHVGPLCAWVNLKPHTNSIVMLLLCVGACIRHPLSQNFIFHSPCYLYVIFFLCVSIICIYGKNLKTPSQWYYDAIFVRGGCGLALFFIRTSLLYRVKPLKFSSSH